MTHEVFQPFFPFPVGANHNKRISDLASLSVSSLVDMIEAVDDEAEALFGSGHTTNPASISPFVAKVASRPLVDKPMHRFAHPSTLSSSLTWADFVDDFVKTLHTQLPESDVVATRDGIAGTSTRQWDRLRHIAGCPMLPGQTPPLNGTSWRQVRNLKPITRDDMIFGLEAVKAVYLAAAELGDHHPPLPIELAPSSGAPHGLHGEQKIKAIVKFMSDLPTLAVWSGSYGKGYDYRLRQDPRLFLSATRMNTGDGVSIDQRGCAVGKERKVIAFDDALAFSKGSERLPISSSKAYVGLTTLVRARARTASASSAPAGYTMACNTRWLSDRIKERFYMMRLSTAGDIAEQRAGARARGLVSSRCTDASNFDTTLTWQVTLGIFSMMHRLGCAGNLSWDSYTSALLVKDLNLGSSKNFILGDPFSYRSHINPGLPSGDPNTSRVGTDHNIFFHAICFRDIGAISSPDEMVAVLDGTHGSLVSAYRGDDARTDMTLDLASRYDDYEWSYVSAEAEIPGKYIGFITSSVDSSVHLDAVSRWTNLFLKEDDAYDRPFGRIGYDAANEVYSTAPDFEVSLSIFETLFKKHFGLVPKDCLREEGVDIDLSAADRTYLANPESIYYKLDVLDVTPQLLVGSLRTINPSATRAARVAMNPGMKK